MVYKITLQETGNVLSAIGAALEETKLGAIIAQGYGIIKNIGKLVIENAARLVGMTAALTTNAATTFGVGVAVAIGAALAGVAAIKAITADDLMSGPTAGSGYGDRILVSKEGTYALNNRDTIQASTVNSSPQSAAVVETKLYIDNEAFAQASSKSFSKL